MSIFVVITDLSLVLRSQTHPTASEGKGLVDYYRAGRSSAFPGYPGKALDKCDVADDLHTAIWAFFHFTTGSFVQ